MLNIQITNKSTIATDSDAIKRLVKYTCLKYGINSADISIAIADDDTISNVHREFLGKNSPTDVISFNLSDVGEKIKTFEIIANSDLAQRCAKERGSRLEAELMLYILHGLLHNIGFDDLCEEDFNRMHTIENDILEELGYGRVFGEENFQDK